MRCDVRLRSLVAASPGEAARSRDTAKLFSPRSSLKTLRWLRGRQVTQGHDVLREVFANYFRSARKKSLHYRAEVIKSRVAQFRTCLWPRAGRWASGQEAGQPPGARSPDSKAEWLEVCGHLSSETT